MRYMLSSAKQGSDEWRAARLGRVTGSIVSDCLSSLRRGSHHKPAIEMALERITGRTADDFLGTADTARGVAQEPYARMAYEVETGKLVVEAGFAFLPTVMAGCSVDGFVGEDGLFEAKCPKSHTHVAYLLDGKLPPEYRPQCIHNLWVTGRKWLDFVSYDSRLPKGAHLFMVRVERDEQEIAEHEKAVMRFLFNVSDIEHQLKERIHASDAKIH